MQTKNMDEIETANLQFDPPMRAADIDESFNTDDDGTEDESEVDEEDTVDPGNWTSG